MTITFFNCDEKVIKMDKVLTGGTPVSGSATTPVDTVNATFLVEADEATVDGSNYIMVDTTPTRYYWIVSKQALTAKLWQLTCKCDLRKSARAAIVASTGVVSRNENNYNMYLNDDQIPVSAKRALEIKKFPTQPFTNAAGRPVVMLVVGGGS